jgi:predicted MPP superfamily phosphohydrolase
VSDIPPELADVARRLGDDIVRRRLKAEDKQVGRLLNPRGKFVHTENVIGFHTVLTLGLKLIGQWQRGLDEFLDVEVHERDVPIAELPDAFDGFRIMHVSDLHIDIEPKLTPIVAEKIAAAADRYDVCVFTGDYRWKSCGPHERSVELMRPIIEAVKPPALAVLGNHDSLYMVEGLEKAGMTILLNEQHRVERGDKQLLIAGIDDPHHYQTDDLGKALGGVDSGTPVVLLSHSPDGLYQAAERGVGLFLCGHTHGGQIRLPNGYAPVKNIRLPRRFAGGGWQEGDMHGYTTRGTGGSSIPVRINCRPEIPIHVLRKIDN